MNKHRGEEEPMLTLDIVMTAGPFTIGRTDLVGPVRDTMLDSGIHCLPVVDDEGHPVGIVSSWDLVEEYAPQDAVENVMTTKVVTVGAHQTPAEAAEIMSANFIHHLVVVDEANAVVGVVSSLDLLMALT